MSSDKNLKRKVYLSQTDDTLWGARSQMHAMSVVFKFFEHTKHELGHHISLFDFNIQNQYGYGYGILMIILPCGS